MPHVNVKICGLTDPAAAADVVAAGADAIGLVFAPSSRQVTAEQAREIAAAAGPDVWKVGVFVNATARQINTAAEIAGLTHAQLHGQESPALVEDLDIPAVKAFAVRDAGAILEVHDWLVCVRHARRIAGVLLDAYDPRAAGGTGKTFNWDILLRARQSDSLAGLPAIFLAGGLTPTNIDDAILVARPEWVDVSSGVESTPGVKDPAQVRAFLAAVRHTEPLLDDPAYDPAR